MSSIDRRETDEGAPVPVFRPDCWRGTSPLSRCTAPNALFRQGKASISAELVGIFERLGFGAQSWQDGMDKLRGERLLGRIFAASRIKLREIAKHLGVRHLVNLRGCPLR
jgi:hypothetical protein